MSQQFKELERWVCQMMGTRRRGQVQAGGWARGSDDDGTGPWSIEVKYTQRAQLRQTWLEQCRRQSRSDGREWMLYIGEHGKPRMDAPTVLRFGQFLALNYDAGWLVNDDPFAVGSASLPPAETNSKSSL